MKLHCSLLLIVALSYAAKIYPGILYQKLYYDTKIEREYVPLDAAPWNVPLPNYKPVNYTAPCYGKKCDPDDVLSIKFNGKENSIDRKSYRGNYKLDENGYPLNPKGRTGVCGRGSLPRWGPNHMVATIMCRKQSKLEVLVSSLEDEKLFDMLKVPAEFVDQPQRTKIGDDSFKTITRILKAQNVTRASIKETIVTMMTKFNSLYKDYTADERNTDNAWVETTIYYYCDLNNDFFEWINPEVSEKTSHWKWTPLDTDVLLTKIEKLAGRSKMNIKDGFIHWAKIRWQKLKTQGYTKIGRVGTALGGVLIRISSAVAGLAG